MVGGGQFRVEIRGCDLFFEVDSPLPAICRRFGFAELVLRRLVPYRETQPVDQLLQLLSQLLIWQSLRSRVALHQR